MYAECIHVHVCVYSVQVHIHGFWNRKDVGLNMSIRICASMMEVFMYCTSDNWKENDSDLYRYVEGRANGPRNTLGPVHSHNLLFPGKLLTCSVDMDGRAQITILINERVSVRTKLITMRVACIYKVMLLLLRKMKVRPLLCKSSFKVSFHPMRAAKWHLVEVLPGAHDD